MTTIITFDVFSDTYRPRVNHLAPDRGFDLRGEGSCLFSSYGVEGDYVRAQDPALVWSVVDGDDGFSMSPGFTVVNLFGYMVTEVAPETGDLCVFDEPDPQDFEEPDEADFSNRDNTLNGEDITAYIEELRTALSVVGLNPDSDSDWPEDAPEAAWDAVETLKALSDFTSDGLYMPSVFIRESYFTEYAEDYCRGLGDIPDFIVVDWEATAEGFKADYRRYEYDGVTYYGRPG